MYLLLHYIAQSLILGLLHPKKSSSGVTEHGFTLPEHPNRATTSQRSKLAQLSLTMSCHSLKLLWTVWLTDCFDIKFCTCCNLLRVYWTHVQWIRVKFITMLQFKRPTERHECVPKTEEFYQDQVQEKFIVTEQTSFRDWRTGRD